MTAVVILKSPLLSLRVRACSLGFSYFSFSLGSAHLGFMADEFIEKCSRLNIIPKEDDIIDLGDSVDARQDDKLSLRLVGRILTDKPPNFEAMKRTLLHVWNLKDDVIIRSLGVNLFVFQFFHWKDRDRILAGRPWCFENRLLVLEEIDANAQPSDMVLNFSPFWIRLYNLPFGYRSNDNIKAIAMAVGDVIEIEEDFLDVNLFCRVRVWLDIAKPLKRFQMIRLKGNGTTKITLKYERLPHFCFLCRCMSHVDKDCPDVADEDKESGFKWGMDIRASPRMGLNRHKEEEEMFRSRPCLFVLKPSSYDHGHKLAVEGGYFSKTQCNGLDIMKNRGFRYGRHAENSSVEVSLYGNDILAGKVDEPRSISSNPTTCIDVPCNIITNMQQVMEPCLHDKVAAPTSLNEGRTMLLEDASPTLNSSSTFHVGLYKPVSGKFHKTKKSARVSNDAHHDSNPGSDPFVNVHQFVDKASSWMWN